MSQSEMYSGVNIKTSLGYMSLDSWILSNIIQLETFDFCRKFLTPSNDPCGRMFDQMTQAARSGQANIAEGSARHQTSIETEMKLLDVARASLNELAGDFMFILLCRGEASWGYSDERRQKVLNFRLEPTSYSQDIVHDAMMHILDQRKHFQSLLDSDDVSTIANSLLILCLRVIKILEKQIAARLEKFKAEGGFTENMTQERLRAKTTTENSPNCPKCGDKMTKRVIKRGSHQGEVFWGCVNYPRCDGALNINSSTD